MQEEQPQNYPGYNPYLYGYQQEPPDLSLVEQTNPREVLKEIEMTLKGFKRGSPKDKDEWILEKGVAPLINNIGLNSLMADAKSVINQNTILSNFDIEQISRLIIRLGISIKSKIKMNWKEFGIDKSNLDTVVFAVTDPAYASLMRAKGEGEKRFLKTSVRAIESFTSQAKPQQGSSTVDKLKFWR